MQASQRIILDRTYFEMRQARDVKFENAARILTSCFSDHRTRWVLASALLVFCSTLTNVLPKAVGIIEHLRCMKHNFFALAILNHYAFGSFHTVCKFLVDYPRIAVGWLKCLSRWYVNENIRAITKVSTRVNAMGFHLSGGKPGRARTKTALNSVFCAWTNRFPFSSFRR